MALRANIEVTNDGTRVILFQHIPFPTLSPSDRLRATYIHACLKHIEGGYATNASLRERFGLDAAGTSKISRLIRDALEEKLIKAHGPTTAPKHMKYIPYWA